MKLIIRALSFFVLLFLFSCSESTSVDSTSDTSQECLYNIIPGKALVTSIALATGNEYKGMSYNGYIVKYKFIPDAKTEAIDFSNKEYTHFVSSENSDRALPSREYIKKYDVEVGGEYTMNAKVIYQGTCVPLLFGSVQLPNEVMNTADVSATKETSTSLDGCDYEVVNGNLVIENLEKVGDVSNSQLAYQEYKIQYKFIPESPLESTHIYADFVDELWTHSILFKGKSVNPGEEYVEKYAVEKGGLFKGEMYLLKEGDCMPFKIVSSELPSNDVSEIIESEIQVPVSELNYASTERVAFEFNPIVNAPYVEWEPADCKYLDVEGYLRVVEVKMLPEDNTTSYLPYRGYSVKYVFTPLYEYNASLLNVNETHEFYLEQDGRKILPGPEYIRKNGIEVNATRTVSVSYPVSGECKRLKIIGGFPNDVSEFNK